MFIRKLKPRDFFYTSATGFLKKNHVFLVSTLEKYPIMIFKKHIHVPEYKFLDNLDKRSLNQAVVLPYTNEKESYRQIQSGYQKVHFFVIRCFFVFSILKLMGLLQREYHHSEATDETHLTSIIIMRNT